MSSVPSYVRIMRIAGSLRLIRPAEDCSRELRGAFLALHAELVVASWHSPEDVLATYPHAEQEAHRLVVSIHGTHCAIIAINYELGIALIEHAGLRLVRTRKDSLTMRRRP